MLAPSSIFCCGFSLSTGVKVILTLHLAMCLIVVGSSFSNIVLRVPSLGYANSFQEQVYAFAFSLCGIPIILAGFCGVVAHAETNMRLYLAYLLLTFVVDLVSLCYYFLLQDACRSIAPAVAGALGHAFLCGAAQITNCAFVSIVISVEVYFIFTVWSFCESIAYGSSKLQIFDLLPEDAEIATRQGGREGPVAGIVGLTYTDLPGPYAGKRSAYSSAYGSLEASGEAGPTIFGGTAHDF